MDASSLRPRSICLNIDPLHDKLGVAGDEALVDRSDKLAQTALVVGEFNHERLAIIGSSGDSIVILIERTQVNRLGHISVDRCDFG